MTRDEVLEVMARAIYDAPGPDGDHVATYFTENFRCDATNRQGSRDFALKVSSMAAAEVLTALEAKGMAVMPKEPTAAMLDSGTDAYLALVLGDGRLGEPDAVAHAIWTAMLAASGSAHAPDTRGEANRITILESALERIAGMDSVGADVRAHCQTALRRARG